MLFTSDLISQYLPWYYLVSVHLKAFLLPHWVPTITNGYPLLAEGETGVLSPINSLILFLLPFPLNVNMLYFVYFVIGLIGMFLFLREYKITKSSSLLGSVVFILSGYITSRYFQPSIIFASLIFPVGMYLVKRAKIKPKIIFLLAPLIYLQVTAGHLQITLICISGYLIFQTINAILENKGYFSVLKTLMIVCLGIMLSAPQLLPSLKLFSISERLDWNPMIRYTYSLPPTHLITYLFPNFFGISKPGDDFGFRQFGGGFWEINLTIWTVPFLISLIPIPFIIKKRNNPIITLYTLWIIFLLLSFGGFFKPNHLISYLPNFPFRAPARFLIVSTFAASALCAFGLDMITKKTPPNFKHILVLLVIITVILQQANSYKSYVLVKPNQEAITEVKNRATNFTTPLVLKKDKLSTTQNMPEIFKKEFEKGLVVSTITVAILLVWVAKDGIKRSVV